MIATEVLGYSGLGGGGFVVLVEQQMFEEHTALLQTMLPPKVLPFILNSHSDSQSYGEEFESCTIMMLEVNMDEAARFLSPNKLVRFETLLEWRPCVHRHSQVLPGSAKDRNRPELLENRRCVHVVHAPVRCAPVCCAPSLVAEQPLFVSDRARPSSLISFFAWVYLLSLRSANSSRLYSFPFEGLPVCRFGYRPDCI